MIEDYKFKPVVAWSNYKLLENELGRMVVTVEVDDNALNPYGNAHGGFLFTLCDGVAGVVAYNYNKRVSTLETSINYIKGVRNGETITVEGNCIHNGKTTKIVEVTIKNSKGELCVKAMFTMFAFNEN